MHNTHWYSDVHTQCTHIDTHLYIHSHNILTHISFTEYTFIHTLTQYRFINSQTPVTHIHRHTPDYRCLYIAAQTQTAPPTKTATPAKTIKASFTAQGVMGTTVQLGVGWRPLRRAVPAQFSLLSAPGRGRVPAPKGSHPNLSSLSPATRLTLSPQSGTQGGSPRSCVGHGGHDGLAS